MFAYITLGTNDIARAARFYDAVMDVLGYARLTTIPTELGYGLPGGNCQLWVNTPFDRNSATVGNGSMPCFNAATRKMVDAFHATGLAQGGSDEGAPGLRSYEADFYACYLRDPDGNKLSAVCIGPE
ncbi:MAG: VOC family protein [Rhodobacteraceae bacterium]|nr:VOC family protein [Paracoccaceae bacterium]